MNTFYFLGYEEFTIQNNNLLKIYILDFKNKFVHTIYKNSSDITKVKNFKPFDNITNFVTFVIKRNGKISLDIK